jgi:hypothetical protein
MILTAYAAAARRDLRLLFRHERFISRDRAASEADEAGEDFRSLTRRQPITPASTAKFHTPARHYTSLPYLFYNARRSFIYLYH